MKTLIVDDDFTSRLLLRECLKSYGPSHLAVNGREAVEAVRIALEAVEPYNLICLDIMMPEMDGQAALKEIRRMEASARVAAPDQAKIVMTTALADRINVVEAARGKCDCFLTKPIQKVKLLEELRKLGLIT
jgi:two-component system, chemotaxis family, chemotaxis protein CheY